MLSLYTHTCAHTVLKLRENAEIKIVENKEVMKRKCLGGTSDDKNGETSAKKLKETQESAEYWAEQYMFQSGSNGRAVCLICGFCVSVVKK